MSPTLRRAVIMSLACASSVVLLSLDALAVDTQDAGLWFGVASGGALGSSSDASPWRWRLMGEGRLRDDSGGFNQSILDGGFGYTLPKGLSLFASYSWLRTWPVSSVPAFDEHRLVQDIAWKHAFGAVDLGLRTRFEERFFSSVDGVALRWRGKAGVRWRPMANGPVALIAREELFLNMKGLSRGVDRGFDQNRIYGGFDVPLSPGGSQRLEIAYLNQLIHPPGGSNTMMHILSIGFRIAP